MKRIRIAVYFLLLVLFGVPLAYAQDGAPTGWWTDAQGNNYYGDPPSDSSSSSDSSYDSGGGYIDPGPSWEEQQYQATQREAVNLNDEAVKYHNAGNIDKAVELYEKAYAKDPANPTILGNLRSVRGTQWNEAANRYYESGNFREAVKHYEKALELKPDSDAIRQNLENARRELDRVNQQQYQQQLKQDQERQASENVKSMLPNLAEQLKPAQKVQSESKSGSLGFGAWSEKPSRRLEFAHPGQSGLPLEGFKNMKPVRHQMIERAEAPAGGSKTASAQAESAQFHGRSLAAAKSDEEASRRAQFGFDSKGDPKEGIEFAPLKGIPPWERDPEIPKERITPEIEKLVGERTEARQKRRDLETELAGLRKAKKPDTVAIAKTRDEISTLQNQEIFVNFSINEKLTKAPDVKRKGK